MSPKKRPTYAVQTPTPRLSYDKREKTVASVVRALGVVMEALEVLHDDSMHPDRCGKSPDNAPSIARAATQVERALSTLRDTLPLGDAVPGVISFTVDLDTLNASLENAGKGPVTEDQVRAAGMQVADGPLDPGPCPCACNSGGQCGGCGHAGCGGRRRTT
jgi:hypothetical protein